MGERILNVTIVVLRDESGFDEAKRAAAEREIGALRPDCVEFVGDRSFHIAFGRLSGQRESPAVRLRAFVAADPRFAFARIGSASGECLARTDLRGRLRDVPLGGTACLAIEEALPAVT